MYVAAETSCHPHDPSVFLGMDLLELPFKNRLETRALLSKLEYLVVINMTTLLPRTFPIKRWFYKCFNCMMYSLGVLSMNMFSLHLTCLDITDISVTNFSIRLYFSKLGFSFVRK